MIEKPHRFLLERVSSYSEEGRAYLRRRRIRSRPFARVRYAGGEEVAFAADSGSGAELFAAATALIGSRDERG